MQAPSLNRWVRVRLVVVGAGDFDRMLVSRKAGLVSRILSSRSKKDKVRPHLSTSAVAVFDFSVRRD